MRRFPGFLPCLAILVATGCGNGDGLSVSRHAMIHGTQDADPAHSGIAALYHTRAKSILCTGVLIHPQWVLTAAHCVTDADESTQTIQPSRENVYVQVGFGAGLEDVRNSLHRSAEFIYHPEYSSYALVKNPNYMSLASDIALIRLAEPVPEETARPILPHPPWIPLNSAKLPIDMFFAGYGFDENAQMGQRLGFTARVTKYCGPQNPTDTDAGCPGQRYDISGCHPAHDISPENYKCYSLASEYVLVPYGGYFYPQGDGGPCQGDSGGPAIVTLGAVEYVAGISSYGDPVCGYYGVSTAVQDFYAWIVSHAPEVASQYVEICGNCIDDDGDGIVDGACTETVECPAEEEEACPHQYDVFGNRKPLDCANPGCALESECQAGDSGGGSGCSAWPASKTRQGAGFLLLGGIVMLCGAVLRRRKV